MKHWQVLLTKTPSKREKEKQKKINNSFTLG
jgi:hypothetical protein